ncbi:MAG: nicotinate phosphoribosyltransferase [Myxococcales bacterium]|nr:nicotinate phosphoribosyltransferase [Myxococcales bacterium]
MTHRLEPLLLGADDYGLATDLYQITMMAAYRARTDVAPDASSTFELFVRKLPRGRAFLVAAGLEQSLAYLRDLRFSDEDVAYLKALPVFAKTDPAFFEWLRAFRFEGDVDAIPEGTLVFPNEPMVRVRAPLAQAQLVETFLLSTINMQTLVASKAARVRMASEQRTFVDFGARRAHGFAAAMMATRASWIAGADGTSNVIAAKKLGIPVLGTAAHAFIMSFEREEDAFAAYHARYPDHCVLLVDTYDTLEGCRKAAAIGPSLRGVRLDSGDLGQLAKECRALLDAEGLTRTRIVASGDLNEDKITKLIADGAPIDSFGVGTELVTSRDQPALGGVFKLVQRTDGDREIPVIKLSEGKITWPGPKQVWRVSAPDGTLDHDVLELADAPGPDGATPLLRPVMRGGAFLDDAYEPLSVMRERCAAGLATLPAGLRRLHDYDAPPVHIGPALNALAETLKGARA